MTREYLELGPTPADEDCQQLGSINYNYVRAKQECAVYIRQLRRQFGPEPPYTHLRTKYFPHDFGTYFEVVCFYDDEDPVSMEYALKCEREAPANWDKEAKIELGI